MKNINILKWALVVSIVVVLNLFFNYSIMLIYKEPKWDNFCKQEQINIIPKTKEECLAKGGSWTENGKTRMEANEAINADKPLIQPITLEPRSYCDQEFTCRKQFEEAQKLYNRNVFVVLIVLGVVSIIASFVLSNITAVSLGLSFGGILSLIVGSVRYWSDMDDYLRVIILGLALAALIWLGVKKIRD